MAIEKVKAYFAQFGMEERVMEAATSSATVEEAAATLGCGPGAYRQNPVLPDG